VPGLKYNCYILKNYTDKKDIDIMDLNSQRKRLLAKAPGNIRK
jgi:hypothetical protein